MKWGYNSCAYDQSMINILHIFTHKVEKWDVFNWKYDVCSTIVAAVSYVISCYIGLFYDGIPLHLIKFLAPGKFEWRFRYLIFQITSVIDGWGISCELALRVMALDLTDDKSTMVQVMAWCRQASSHYLSQWWSRSLLLYCVIRPQWVK